MHNDLKKSYLVLKYYILKFIKKKKKYFYILKFIKIKREFGTFPPPKPLVFIILAAFFERYAFVKIANI